MFPIPFLQGSLCRPPLEWPVSISKSAKEQHCRECDPIPQACNASAPLSTLGTNPIQRSSEGPPSRGALTYLSVIKKLKSLHSTLRLLGDFKDWMGGSSDVFSSRSRHPFHIKYVGEECCPKGAGGFRGPLINADASI